MTQTNSASDKSQGSPLFLGAVCLVASLGGLLFGFDTAVISGTFGFVEKQYLRTKFEIGWFGSSALVGCILGAAVAGWMSDRFGRKPLLLISSALFFISALYSAIPASFQILIWARIIGGVGVGMASVVAPLYISEFSPPRLRGSLVATYQLSIVIGILAAYFSNWWLLGFAQSHPLAFGGRGPLHWTMVAEVWRGMFGAEMIPCVLFSLLLLFVPESPRWLAQHGHVDRAFDLLARVGGQEMARREMAGIQDDPADKAGSIRELFQPGLRMALLVAVGLSVFGQMTGVNIVVYYGPPFSKRLDSNSAARCNSRLGLASSTSSSPPGPLENRQLGPAPSPHLGNGGGGGGASDRRDPIPVQGRGGPLDRPRPRRVYGLRSPVDLRGDLGPHP